MGFREWWYKNFCQRQWPKTIQIRLSFHGKGSDDTLYYSDKEIPFDKPLELKYVSKEYSYDTRWAVESIIRKEYKALVLEECKKELVIARQEQYITLEGEERITGDYIVAVDGYADVGEWRPLSYEEWLMLRAMELNNKRKEEK